ncbi:MAG: acetyl-CoA carboxylase biotin carboxyl carrier protein subunit [Alphaproteobacteria bacterium]|jgi:biotin carboxyl carrier protein
MADVTVESEIPGKVLRIEAGPGTVVQEDDPVIFVESMKMEIPIGAPSAGTVKEILVAEGDSIEEGDEVFVMET